MKTITLTRTTVSLLSVVWFGSLPLKAQTPEPSPAATPFCAGKHGKCHGKEWLAVLNDQERSRLKAAMKRVKNDPQLVAARQAAKDAQTKEAKAAAHETLRQTRRDLLLKADPGLAPILEKLKASKPSAA